MDKNIQSENFEELSIDKTLEKLAVNPEKGLNQQEVDKRKQKFGANTIEEKKENPILKFLSHFWGPIPWMIEVAVVLSAIAQRWEDFAVIFIMLLINGGVSYWHENKASNAIAALKEKLAPESTVIRNGKKKTINADELVPGDIVWVKMGNIIPADAKLLNNESISADESALTGESLPVDKQEGDLCFSGTTVKRGEAKAVVIATGRNTKFAQTVELVESAEEKSHFRKAVLKMGYYLIGITAVLVSVIIISTWIRGEPLIEILLFALVVTIAGIPQALPAVLSVTMTIGANRLAKMKAIVARLSAMEEMAGLEVLCADKTGTLTKNELKLQEPVNFKAGSIEELKMAAALTAKRDEEDPIDSAILESIDKTELDKYEVVDFKPFDPSRKRAESKIKHGDEEFSLTKGAPQIILDIADVCQEEQNEISHKVQELGDKGFRSLGVARSEGDKWEYLGLLPLLDPPREDAEQVLKSAQKHGIDIRMITGDHKAIAKQVAGKIGLQKNIIDAARFFENKNTEKQEKTDENLNEEFTNYAGYAQVIPEHKFKIIKHFQRKQKIVGMTGDGVNDAPALKQADVGIAVSNATDAARSAAALVLTAPGLKVITRAVEEARRIFERMTGYATFRITESLRVLLFMTLSILFFHFYPVTPIMVVLLAILNDIPIMTIAFDNVKTATNPVRWNMRRVLSIATILSLGGVISTFILFWLLKNYFHLPRETIQTMIFLKLLVAGHMTIFLTRNTGWMWDKPYPNLKLFVALEGTQIIGTLFAVYGWLVHPVGWAKALAVWGYAIVWLLILNMVKVVGIKLFKQYFKKAKLVKNIRHLNFN